MRTAIVLCMLLIALPVWAGAFKDDFDDGDLNGWTVMNGQWYVQGGELVCENNTNDVVILYIGEISWKDYEVVFDAKVTEHSGKWFFGGMLRFYENPVTNLWYGLGSNPPNFADTVQAGVVFQGVQPRFTAFRNFPTELGKWYKQRVTLKGTEFNHYVDDEPIISEDWGDTPLPENGRLGLWNTFLGEYHYDNFVAIGDEIPDAGSFAIRPTGKLTITWGQIRGK